MGQVICSWLLVVFLITNFLFVVYRDFNGTLEKKPEGFIGFIGTCIAFVITAAVMWGAGAFVAITN